jgi:hypothetical protein
MVFSMEVTDTETIKEEIFEQWSAPLKVERCKKLPCFR